MLILLQKRPASRAAPIVSIAPHSSYETASPAFEGWYLLSTKPLGIWGVVLAQYYAPRHLRGNASIFFVVFEMGADTFLPSR